MYLSLDAPFEIEDRSDGSNSSPRDDAARRTGYLAGCSFEIEEEVNGRNMLRPY